MKNPYVIIGIISGLVMVISGCSMITGQAMIPEATRLEKIADGFKFTEGCACDQFGNIYFADIPESKIWKWTTQDQLELFRDDSQRANGLALDRDGALIACESSGDRRLVRIDVNNGELTVLADQYAHKKFNSINDLWIDSRGGVYFTDPRYGNRDGMEQDGEHVYYLNPDRKKVIRVIDDMVGPNGIMGARDGKYLFVADQKDGKTYKYRVLSDGSLTDKKIFVSVGSDGVTMDKKGNLYLTHDKVVEVFNQEGESIGSIEIPESPTNLCFGGPGRQTLYITARSSVFRIKTNMNGVYSN